MEEGGALLVDGHKCYPLAASSMAVLVSYRLYSTIRSHSEVFYATRRVN